MRNIHKFYGRVHALKGVDFKIYEGEIVGLIGDNGAGKSTLAKIIAGVIRKDMGEIYWKGKKVEIKSVHDARKLGIEMAFQEQALVDSLDLALNLFLGREIASGALKVLNYKKMYEETKKALKTLGLKIAENPKREIRFCSGGERQGVVIARAMYFKSKLVILDEPTRNLSVAGERMVLNFVKNLKKENISCIFITHALRHVYEVSDRIVVLASGVKILDIPKIGRSLEELEDIIMKSSAMVAE
ncbi:sugar ABC transporter ATP-binding protein [Candidatus Bathyarchaeota archaeon]|nr:MAG: sugar ABC transporter ATP-binding protein [Candidatus Bathyarchaeota archaeon]